MDLYDEGTRFNGFLCSLGVNNIANFLHVWIFVEYESFYLFSSGIISMVILCEILIHKQTWEIHLNELNLYMFVNK